MEGYLLFHLQLNINHKKIPWGKEPQPQISWNLLDCLWTVLQLDQCIMSWHGPSLCADSSVTLRDPAKYISVVSPSQRVPVPYKPLVEPMMVCVSGGHEGKQNLPPSLFTPVWYLSRETPGSDKSPGSVWLNPQAGVWDNDLCFTVCDCVDTFHRYHFHFVFASIKTDS